MRTKIRVERIDRLERERRFQVTVTTPAAALARLTDAELDAVSQFATAAQGCGDDEIAALLAAHSEWWPAVGRLGAIGEALGTVWG